MVENFTKTVDSFQFLPKFYRSNGHLKAYTHFWAHLSRTSLNADAEHIVRQIDGRKDNYRRGMTRAPFWT